MYLFKFFSSLDNPTSKKKKKKIPRLQGGLNPSFTHLLFYGKTETTGSFYFLSKKGNKYGNTNAIRRA